YLDAGAIVNHPGCSTCWGACQGVLAKGQTMISSANRNFKGRAGSPESDIYLASPATVIASAIEGKITDPRKFLKEIE
ncbi:MAG: aconitase family protein, partial [Desulfobacterales bacterium]|nr:aconitase family protein [Desulfobacterales bacterium]